MKNVPNILTVMRMIMVPFFVVLFFSVSHSAALIIFLVAFITDIADGFIARKYNAVTDLGKVLDPLADKFMKLTALCCLALKNIIPVWIFLAMLTLDLMLIFPSAILYKRKFVVSSNIVGKAGTLFITVAILLCFVGTNGLNMVFLYAGLTTVLVSMIVYALNYLSKIRQTEKTL